jgi:NAD+ synthase
MVGYFTKYGDGGVDFLPIGDLYKTEVLELARYLRVPEKIVKKRPSAGLWINQSDEEELGMSYEVLDEILKSLDRGNVEETKRRFGELVERALKMVRKSEHKRLQPPIAHVRDLLRGDEK